MGCRDRDRDRDREVIALRAERDDLLRRVLLLKEALDYPGPHPVVHHDVQAKVRQMWPLLFRRIDHLVEVVAHE